MCCLGEDVLFDEEYASIESKISMDVSTKYSPYYFFNPFPIKACCRCNVGCESNTKYFHFGDLHYPVKRK